MMSTHVNTSTCGPTTVGSRCGPFSLVPVHDRPRHQIYQQRPKTKAKTVETTARTSLKTELTQPWCIHHTHNPRGLMSMTIPSETLQDPGEMEIQAR